MVPTETEPRYDQPEEIHPSKEQDLSRCGIDKNRLAELLPPDEAVAGATTAPVNVNTEPKDTKEMPQDDRSPPKPPSTFLQNTKRQFSEVGRLYWEVIKKPQLILSGAAAVAKDVLWELPKSLLKTNRHLTQAQRLSMNSSQALTISEIAAFPGTYGGIALWKFLGSGDWGAGMVGSIVGNYVSAVASFVAAYLLLTKQGLKDSLKIIRDCAPAAATLYAVNGPIAASLLALGCSPELAATINMIWGTILFTGVAKIAANKEIAGGETRV